MDHDDIKSWLNSVENKDMDKFDKVTYALRKYWCDLCESENNYNKKQEDIIYKAFEKLPLFWDNIVNYIISVHRYVDPIQEEYVYHYIDQANNLIETIQGLVTDDREADTFTVPYFIENTKIVPFYIISKAAAEVRLYNYLNHAIHKKTFLGMCGIPQNIEVGEHITFWCSEYDLMPYGLAMMRSYFSARFIQRKWRAYVTKKNLAAQTIQRAWKRQVLSPFTVIGMNRLQREFNELIEV